jgi:predicted transcriptional regulator
MITEVADIVARYVANASVRPADLPILIKAIHASLVSVQTPSEPEPAHQEPAMPLRRLVTPESIACAECGVRLKTIRRHLREVHGLSPEAYIAKWGLRKDHPMVAPAYADVRSGLARKAGLGRKPEPVEAEAPAKPAPPTAKPAVKRSAARVSEPALAPTMKTMARPHPKPSKRVAKVAVDDAADTNDAERKIPPEPMFD